MELGAKNGTCMAVSAISWGSFLYVGVLVVRALLFRIYVGAPSVFENSNIIC